MTAAGHRPPAALWRRAPRAAARLAPPARSGRRERSTEDPHPRPRATVAGTMHPVRAAGPFVLPPSSCRKYSQGGEWPQARGGPAAPPLRIGQGRRRRHQPAAAAVPVATTGRRLRRTCGGSRLRAGVGRACDRGGGERSPGPRPAGDRDHLRLALRDGGSGASADAADHTGLAVAALRIGAWNIGAGGQVDIGAFCAAGMGPFVPAPPAVLLPAMILAGVVGGGCSGPACRRWRGPGRTCRS